MSDKIYSLLSANEPHFKRSGADARKFASERRRLKRQRERSSNIICYACREPGHSAKFCPKALGADVECGDEKKLGKQVVGICYRYASSRPGFILIDVSFQDLAQKSMAFPSARLHWILRILYRSHRALFALARVILHLHALRTSRKVSIPTVVAASYVARQPT